MKKVTSHTWLTQEFELVTAEMVCIFFTGLNKLMLKHSLAHKTKENFL